MRQQSVISRIILAGMWGFAVLAGAKWVRDEVDRMLAMPLFAAALAGVFAVAALMAGRPRFGRTWIRTVARVRLMPRDGRRWKWQPFALAFADVPGRRFSVVRAFALLAAVCVPAGVLAVRGAIAYAMKDAPADLDAVLAYSPPVSTHVRSSDGELICTFSTENRRWIAIDRVPPHVQEAFIAAEDSEFRQHGGIDGMAIVRAFIANWQGGRVRQGGSTITQQVVKLVVLRSGERSYMRKIREAALAVELDRRLTKEQILEVYLNHIYLGRRAYGIAAAARTYFGKEVADLTLAESAMLAGLPQAPSRYSPYTNYGEARRRQRYVLDRMVAAGSVTAVQADAAWREEIAVIRHQDPLNLTASPYICELARRELIRLYGERAVFEEGLDVTVTVDMRMQRTAEVAVRRGLVDLERRIGFNGPDGNDAAYDGCLPPSEPIPDGLIEIGRVDDDGRTVCVRGGTYPLDDDDRRRIAAWTRSTRTSLRRGDMVHVRIELREGASPGAVAVLSRRTGGPGRPEALQAALIAIDPVSGELRALAGGYDFNESQYNGVTQVRRQIGSSVKPYVYLAALRDGMPVDEMVTDHPVCYRTASGWWCPENYRGPHTVRQYRGRVPLRAALALSLNSVSVQLAARSGMGDVIRTMRDLGVSSPVPRVLPVAVGAAELTLWEHAYAYAVIAGNGVEMPRHPEGGAPGVFLRSVIDRRGTVLYAYDRDAPRRQAIDAADAYRLTYLMRGVVEEGTGRRVQELGRPAAGKTGTTNDFRDAWFMGFTADLVVGVWVGRTVPAPIAEEATGGAVALPIWMAFMRDAHPDVPPREFPVPADVVLLPGYRGEPVPYRRGQVPERRLPSTRSVAHAMDAP